MKLRLPNVLLSFQMSVPRYSKSNTRSQRCLHKNAASKISLSTEPIVTIIFTA